MTSEKTVVLLEHIVTKYMELMEKNSDLSFVKSSNELKRKIDETKKEIEFLQNHVEELEKDINFHLN